MAQTIAAAFSDFLTALTGVFFSLVNSVLAVFQAIALLGKEIFVGAVQLGESVVSLLLGLLQGVYGFVAANVLAIVVIGGGYYIYTTRNTTKRGKHVK